MRDPEPLPFENSGHPTAEQGEEPCVCGVTLPDIDRIARETPSLVLGVRDPGLQADVCNEKETSARHR